jgi:multimeric flavodoxin WrbA
MLNDKGQYAYYGKVGGCIVTGREGGIKHAAMNVLYSLQNMGFTIPPQSDAGWIGEAGPNATYGEEEINGKLGWSNEYTKRGITFMTWNAMHLASMLKKAGGIPAHGNQRTEWDTNLRYDFLDPDDIT